MRQNLESFHDLDSNTSVSESKSKYNQLLLKPLKCECIQKNKLINTIILWILCILLITCTVILAYKYSIDLDTPRDVIYRKNNKYSYIYITNNSESFNDDRIYEKVSELERGVYYAQLQFDQNKPYKINFKDKPQSIDLMLRPHQNYEEKYFGKTVYDVCHC